MPNPLGLPNKLENLPPLETKSNETNFIETPIIKKTIKKYIISFKITIPFSLIDLTTMDGISIINKMALHRHSIR